MSWSYDVAQKVWKCTQYSDLQYAEINNFAQYGQPVSPYQPGFVHDLDQDFANLVIEMPQDQVMNHGYGKNITTLDFPLVNHFLDYGVPTDDEDVAKKGVGTSAELGVGSYSLELLIKNKTMRNGARFIRTNLYGWGSYGISAGEISAGDAAYIHGTVSFALMKNSLLVVTANERRVEGEIGAGDDNWDFDSSTINPLVNATVAVLAGPDHYNLEGPIKIQFRGDGKRMVATKKL